MSIDNKEDIKNIAFLEFYLQPINSKNQLFLSIDFLRKWNFEFGSSMSRKFKESKVDIENRTNSFQIFSKVSQKKKVLILYENLFKTRN